MQAALLLAPARAVAQKAAEKLEAELVEAQED